VGEQTTVNRVSAGRNPLRACEIRAEGARMSEDRTTRPGTLSTQAAVMEMPTRQLIVSSVHHAGCQCPLRTDHPRRSATSQVSYA
jgi:hypothetical protein